VRGPGLLPWLGILAGVLAAVLAPARSGADPDGPKIAGLMTCGPVLSARWPWSGAWVFPVGDSLDLSHPAYGMPAYHINRNIIPETPLRQRHDGADLANGQGGGRVRAAANGVVVCVDRGVGGGYGTHIVLAHRIDDGSLVYSVYAHLIPRSVRVREGAVVRAGQRMARVGQTGRATSPHLHFEVRVPEDSTVRWENCPVVDPVAFIRKRLPTSRSDSAWATPYLRWAEFAGLIPRGIDPKAHVDSALFVRAMLRAGTGEDQTWASDIVVASSRRGGDGASWNTIVRGLGALSAGPTRLQACPVGLQRYGRTCEKRLGIRRPAHQLTRLAGRVKSPTVAELCLALADFAPRPAPPAKKKPPANLAASP
jgi:hypothetical protein